ncbi:hypothetical protein BHE74_00058385 [Ensete ventricosum]|uniref:Uncharacterized protein n=1 Tax=Ensete ventricosum TaxID=4639 RepID=A0A445MMJ2_ENSVE|nr:hypothetical protein BHE74_00058385 [Ensete ventricosum]RZR75462.1 hypothetical protein BHM03_00058446 [Ensete ventricosum]
MPVERILTRCQGDHCVANRGEGLTAVDFGGGDAATAGAKGSKRSVAIVDLLSFDSEKELVVPSLQSTERRWAVAHTDTVGRENRAAEAAGGMAPTSRCISHRLLQMG